MKIFKTRSVYSNQKMNSIVQFCYGAKLYLHNGRKFWRKKLIRFQNFYYIKKAAIVSNFCLIGKIPHDFLALTSIELARKTFIGIQVKVSIEWHALWFLSTTCLKRLVSPFCSLHNQWSAVVLIFFQKKLQSPLF